MYTRIYPIGKKNLHITGDYLSQNEEIWGRKDKVETDQSKETEQMLRLWALDRLRRHCEPTVTITIGGLELSQATGEPLDIDGESSIKSRISLDAIYESIRSDGAWIEVKE